MKRCRVDLEGPGDSEPRIELPQDGFAVRTHVGSIPGTNGVGESFAHGNSHRLLWCVMEVFAKSSLTKLDIGSGVEDELVPRVVN